MGKKISARAEVSGGITLLVAVKPDLRDDLAVLARVNGCEPAVYAGKILDLYVNGRRGLLSELKATRSRPAQSEQGAEHE